MHFEFLGTEAGVVEGFALAILTLRFFNLWASSTECNITYGTVG
jgi:hypothetical protein